MDVKKVCIKLEFPLVRYDELVEYQLNHENTWISEDCLLAGNANSLASCNLSDRHAEKLKDKVISAPDVGYYDTAHDEPQYRESFWNCHFCKKNFTRYSYLQNHLQSDHADEISKYNVRCVSFTDFTNLSDYNNVEHFSNYNVSDAGATDLNFNCNSMVDSSETRKRNNWQDYTLSSLNYAKHHVGISNNKRSRHQSNEKSIGDSSSKDLTQSSDLKSSITICNGEKRYQCPYCHKHFRAKGNLTRHVLVHIGQKSHLCDICYKGFKSSEYLQMHRKIHTANKQYHCKTCDKVFALKCELQLHKVFHVGERSRRRCDVCHKEFANSGYLRRHVMIHTGEKPFRCNVCGKRFRQKHCLRVHVRHHTGEKPHQCDICDKAFTTRSEVRCHRRIHTGENPYACNLCDKAFKWITSLKDHKKIHTGERNFCCNLCDRLFSRKSSLTRHTLRVHKKGNPKKCDSAEEFT